MESVEHIRVDTGKFGGCVDVWQNAASHFAISAPDRYVRVVVKFSDLNYDYGNGIEVEAFYSPDLLYWRADIPPTAFPQGGKVLFKIYGEGTDGDRKVLGSGYCRIHTGFTIDPADSTATALNG